MDKDSSEKISHYLTDRIEEIKDGTYIPQYERFVSLPEFSGINRRTFRIARNMWYLQNLNMPFDRFTTRLEKGYVLNLNEGEKILYKFYGKLSHVLREMKPSGQFKSNSNPFWVAMSYAKIIITNNRIIAQGENEVKGDSISTGSIILDLIVVPLSEISREKYLDKIRDEYPRDGYEFPIKNIGKLRKLRKGIRFEVKGGNFPGIVSIAPREKFQVKLVFEFLSKFNKIE